MSAMFPDNAPYYLMSNWKPFAEPFEKNNKKIAVEESYGSLNLSSIETALIQICGRFAERYASDLFISHDTVRELLEPHDPADDGHYLLMFGVRADGVDCNGFVASRLAHTLIGPPDTPRLAHIQQEYRKLLALGIQYIPTPDKTGTPFRRLELKDLTHSSIRLDQDFLADHGIRN